MQRGLPLAGDQLMTNIKHVWLGEEEPQTEHRSSRNLGLFYSILFFLSAKMICVLVSPVLSWAGWSAFVKSDIRRSTPRQAPSVCIKVTLLIESHDHSTTHFIQLQPTIWYWSLIGSWSETGDVSWFHLKGVFFFFLMIKPYRSVKLILGFVCFGSVYLLCHQFPCILSKSGCAPAEVGSVG